MRARERPVARISIIGKVNSAAPQSFHSVEEFAKKAFKHVGLNYKDFVVLDKSLIRPTEVKSLLANYSKAKKVLKWKPKISFDDLVTSMVESDLEFVSKYKY